MYVRISSLGLLPILPCFPDPPLPRRSMTRITEKVRDIVEVRPYTSIADFQREPDATFVNYHFTDVTAYMMARWLEAVTSNRPEQAVRAVAGFRGVGKSHFLSTFSIILSNPEIRSRITDSHVLSSSQQLLRRHYPIINLRRGTRNTLLQELESAIASAFDLPAAGVPASLSELISTISARANGLTPILIIDSSPDRSAPISRNDGDVLSSIADACRGKGIFVGLALDDDIAGADGSNASVSNNYYIEYLDQEHLHKVVNANIFPKNPRTQSVLGRLYSEFRSKIPDFRWSEQRFNQLYPLHPATFELAPFIRSYLPRFTFLGFAASAGERILSRPADSLIGIEEVFDTVERDLRKIVELKHGFEAFDRASTIASTDFPVTSRYQAKLVLKALMLNSLAHRAVTASEIAGSLMIGNEDLRNATTEIESTLNAFAAALAEAITVDRSAQGQPKYVINIGTDEFVAALRDKVALVPESVVESLFRVNIGERFPELKTAFTDGFTECETYWRGSIRPGKLSVGPDLKGPPRRLDWEVTLVMPDDARPAPDRSEAHPLIDWKVGKLTVDERSAFLTMGVLNGDADLRAAHPDQYSTALASASRTISSAVERVMVRDARLVIDGFDYNFSEPAQHAGNVSEMLGIMLEPIFEALYPDHPCFVDTLTPDIVQRYISCLSENEHGRSDQHALTFGVPVGLVEHADTGFTIVSKERLNEFLLVSEILEFLKQEGIDQLSLLDVEKFLTDSPRGLSTEVMQLLLSTMAFRGLIDFVTNEGQHFGGKAIDLKLDWDSIKSIALPRQFNAPPEKLLEWARVISGASTIGSLNEPADRARVLEAFVEISAQWERRNPFAELSRIPDCEFNTEIWRHSSRTWEEYSAMALNVDEALLGNITLEECLDRIRTGFGDRPKAFFDARESVIALEDFVRSYAEKSRIVKYLAMAQITNDQEVESARERLRSVLHDLGGAANDGKLRELGYAWDKFLRVYTAFYVEMHTKFASAIDFRQFAVDTLGAETFQHLLSTEQNANLVMNGKTSLRNLRRRLARMKCSVDPMPLLQIAPYCVCGLQPSMRNALEREASTLLHIASESGHATFLRANGFLSAAELADLG
jgi:hypothetical protein